MDLKEYEASVHYLVIEAKVYLAKDVDEYFAKMTKDNCKKAANILEGVVDLKQKLHDAEMAKDDAEAANTEYRIENEKLKAENERLTCERETILENYKNMVDEANNNVNLYYAERRAHKATRRALWLERAERASAWQIHFSLCHNHSIEREFCINGASVPCEGMMTMRTARDWAVIWKKVEQLCRAKAEEFK